MKISAKQFIIFLILLSLFAGLAHNRQPRVQAASNSPDLTLPSAWNLETIGQISGPVRAVTVEGSYAYVGSGDVLTIYDLSNPASPLPVGSILSVFSTIEEIKVAGGYAYVSDGYGRVAVVDVSDPLYPLITGYYDTPSFAHELAVSGSYLYVADFDTGLHVVDVSDPAAPLEVGDLEWVMTNGVDVSGEVAYVLNVALGLMAVDITNPSAPFEISTLEMISDTMDVAVSDGYAYIANDLYGLKVVDVSDPAHMVEVGSYDTPGYAMEVEISGNYAYVADSISGLRVIDISDPTHPRETGFYDTPEWAMMPAVYGDYAYIADNLGGLYIVDVSDPASPSLANAYLTPGDAADVTLSGDFAYITDAYLGLLIMDISVPAYPVGIGLYDSPGYLQSVALAGELAYLADDGMGLRIVDISDPYHPHEIGFYDTPGTALDVAVSGNYAYIADYLGGLHIVDVSDPTAPLEVYSNDLPFVNQVVVAGNYLYVLIGYLHFGTGSILILDISNPSAPVEVATYPCTIAPSDLAVQGDYLYLADSGLRVVDVSDPANPVETGFYATPLFGSGLAVSGEYAYMTIGGYESGASLLAIDISNPNAPVELNSAPMSYALGVAVSGDLVYAAANGYGLYVMRFTPPQEVTDFRILRDGYSFPNYGAKEYSDYTYFDMSLMFGESAVYWAGEPSIDVRSQATLWNVQNYQMMNYGHSYGMAVSGLRFLKDLDDYPGAAYVSLLDKSSEVLFSWEGESITTTVRKDIGFFLVSQFVEPVRTAIHQARAQTPAEVFAQVQTAMTGDDADPLVLLAYAEGSGHALIPYALANLSAGVFSVWVYDNQYPADTDRAVVFDLNDNTWSYDTENGVWSGDSSSHTLGIIALSVNNQPLQCPWCASSHLLTLEGDGHLLITDSQGRRLGFTAHQYLEEIPGGYGSIPILGSKVTHEPVYTLPLTDTYTILVDGQTVMDTQPASLWQFGPGYGVAVQGMAISPGTQDQLAISSIGNQISYHASQPQELALTLAVDVLNASYGLNVQRIDIGATETFSLTADTVNGNLQLDGSLISGGLYNLLITKTSAEDVSTFTHRQIDLLPGDTHLLLFGTWDGSGTITLQIDHGSDGIYDETIELENQVTWMFLPFTHK